MKISVLIPTYNSAKLIRATLGSVLRQTRPPDEILVLDDGSTDGTISILNSYKPGVTVLQQQNRGVAAARNELCRRAGGDLIAFLDHDDIWHPGYLETQCKLHAMFPGAAASFTGHVSFRGYNDYQWTEDPLAAETTAELIGAFRFLKSYHKDLGNFASMSFCCLPKSTLESVGPNPFCEQVSGVDDFYLCNLLPLIGPVAYLDKKVVAYRITREAQSVNCLLGTKKALAALNLVKDRYLGQRDTELTLLFTEVHAAKHRQHARILFGAGQRSCARKEVYLSFQHCRTFKSICKSIGLLSAFRLPRALQPKWPPSIRGIR